MTEIEDLFVMRSGFRLISPADFTKMVTAFKKYLFFLYFYEIFLKPKQRFEDVVNSKNAFSQEYVSGWEESKDFY